MENIDNINTQSGVEICVALQDFIYGGKVKVAVPSIQPLLDSSKITETQNKINLSNLMNKDKNGFNIKNKECKCVNYISVLIPEELYRYRNECSKLLKYRGFKGEKFAITFLGGNLDKPFILGRL